MFRTGHDRGFRFEIIPLEALYPCLGQLNTEIGILARPLGDAAPALVARHIDHRRKGPVQALGGRFQRSGPRRAHGQV